MKGMHDGELEQLETPQQRMERMAKKSAEHHSRRVKRTRVELKAFRAANKETDDGET